MNYETFEPGENLASLIKCYWTLSGPAESVPQRQTIVADGCMEMIFHLGDLYRQYPENGKSIIQPRSFVFGQITLPLEIEPTGITDIFSVRFHPDGFLPFATISIREMENRAVALEKIFGEEGFKLEQLILNAETVEQRIAIIEKFLSDRLSDSAVVDSIVKSTVDTILTANGQISVDELSKQNQINRRQLERKFSSAIGLSPKQLSKTIRLQATLKLLLSGKVTSLTSAAHEGDYYDQAHFIKDFREFTGYTPKEFYGDQLKMTSFFIAD